MSPLPNRRPPSYSAKMRATDLPPILPSTLGNMLPTCTLEHTYRLWRTGGRAVGNMSEEPKISMAWYLFSRVAPRRRTRSVSPYRYGPVLQILQNGFGQGPFLVQTVLLSEPCSTRFER